MFTLLIKQGYKKIGLTVGRPEKDSASTAIVLEAYRKIIGSADSSLIFRDCRTYEDGIKAGEYFSKVEDLEVIVTNGDDVAAGILQKLSLDKVNVIGAENLLSSQLLKFPTVDHHLDLCGEKAFGLLFEKGVQVKRIPSTFIDHF